MGKYFNCFYRNLTLIIILLKLCEYTQAQRTPPSAYSSTTVFNSVKTWDALAPDQTASHLITRSVQDVRQTSSFYDGLGRVIQKVVKGVSPAGNDFVTPVVYDNMSREQFMYLPFPSTSAQTGDITNDGNIKLDAFQQQAAFYTNTPILQNQGERYFYKQINYETSPLSRVTSTLPEGNNWIGASKGTTQQYYSNTAADNVRIWSLSASFTTVPNTTPPVPVSSAAYPAGTLYKTVTIDAANNQFVEYTDIEGKVILRQVQASPTPGTNHLGWLNTYYIYDNLNKLRYILQPQAVQLLLNSSTWNLSSIANLLPGLCFYYEYDQRNRLIIKRIPGEQPVYMVYDGLDRLVMTQDGNLRSAGKWFVTMYENNLDRPTQTGLLADATTTFATHLSNAYGSTAYPNTSANFELLTQTWYDNYTWQTGTPLSAGFDATQSSSSGFMGASDVNPPYPRAVSLTSYTTTGLVTGAKAEILGTSSYLYTANYYDDHDRIIQVQSTNISGGVDKTTNQFSFDGELLVTQTKNVKNGSNAQTNTIQSIMTYDPAGRLTGITKSITSAAGTISKTLVANSYNELGELLTKILGPTSSSSNGPIDKLTYDYNIRNWLLGINRNYINSATSIAITNSIPAPGNYFGEELAYDKLTSYSPMTYAAAQLNGNIAGTIWKSTGDGINRKYDFTYDNANRLTAANFAQVTPTNAVAVDYSVGNLAYDANGNILSMNQKGFRLGSPTGFIDQLTYTYYAASNQLRNVNDAANNPQTILSDFRSSSAYMTALGTKTAAAYDYYYDNNGNLVTDQNKDIGTLNNSTGALTAQGVSYNYLNLPKQVTFNSNKGTITYVYDAVGNKLQKITAENGGTVIYNGSTYTGVQINTTTTYIGSFVYQSISYPNNTTLNSSPLQHGDVLQFVGHEEGRIRVLYNNTTNSNTVTGYAFDYFVKDHLGNTRLVLTDEIVSDPPYLATMETGNATAEQLVFANVSQTRVPKPSGFDAQSGNQSVALTNFNSNKIGPSLLLKVMAGDMLSISVNAYYNATSGTNYNIGTLAAADLLSNLLSTSTGIPITGSTHATLTDLQNNSSVINSSTQNFLNNRTAPNASVPKAYLNYIFLDDQFQYAGGYAAPVTSASATSAQSLKPPLYPVAVPKNGYVYVYVSNESNYNVYFDNLQVLYQHSPILEDNAYYPFGLSMAGISDKAIKLNYAENRYRFLDKELQNKEFSDGSGLDDYDLGARYYDPQIGRFNQIDPLAEYMKRWSPYVYCFDNPVRFIDPSGTQGQDTVIQANDCDCFLKDGKPEIVDIEGVLASTSKKGGFWSWVSRGVDLIPFVGSVKQIITGVYHGDWKEATMGVVFLVVDIGTAGEGGELLKLGEEGLEILAKDEVEEVAKTEAKEVFELGERSYGEIKAAGESDAHHVIQDAAAKDLPGYARRDAPAVKLEGPANVKGTPHYKATAAQKVSNGYKRGTYARERVIGYKALKAAGYPKEAAKQAIRNADKYFKSIGVDMKTVTRIPGN